MRIYATTQDASSSALDAVVFAVKVMFWAWLGFFAAAASLLVLDQFIGESPGVAGVALIAVPVDFAAYAAVRILKAGRLRWSRS